MRLFGHNASAFFFLGLSSVLGAVRINRTNVLIPVHESHGIGHSRCTQRAIRTPVSSCEPPRKFLRCVRTMHSTIFFRLAGLQLALTVFLVSVPVRIDC
jgi:hypothetical protein